MAVDGVTKEKKKKKKIKVEEEEDAGNSNVVQCHDVSVQTAVKKEPLEVNTRDEEKKKKKKKKKVKEEVEAIPVTVCYDASVQTTVKAELSETNISEAPEKTMKKKKRKTKEEPEPLQEIISEDGECLVSKKKKAKKKGSTDEVEGMKNKKKKKEVEVKEEEEEEEVDLGHGVEIVEKKKKKKRKNEQELNTELQDGQTKKKRKKKEADECNEEKQKVKKKKKKPSADDASAKEEPEKKSKKQKKNFKGESHPHANGGHISSSDKKTKRKEKADDVSGKMEAEPAGKKGWEEEGNKALEEVKKQRTSRAAIVFLSEKRGNQDEVSIDQERRLALQRDVDKESQPKLNLGQWGTARFDSSDRQEKFLRLMGGFKKSSQPVTGSSGLANMALGKEGQQTLQQGLLGEFERAQSRHMDFKIKGAGLGFTAPSNKKFTIDTNARNSIRFDD